MILYLSSPQHTNLLDFTGLFEPDSRTPIKKMVGNFMLRQFVIYDMRSFAHFTDVVLDRPAFGDTDEEFAEAVEELELNDNKCLVLGVGCSCNGNGMLGGDDFQCAHGRAAAGRGSGPRWT